MAEDAGSPGDEISYAEFGTRFFKHAVTEERIQGALSSLAGNRIEFGPIGAGPGRLAQVSAVGVVGAASATHAHGDKVAFRLEKPHIQKARDIDVAARIDRAWTP